MTETDSKVMLLNGSNIAKTFPQVEMGLKNMLLIISIGYTAQRWYFLRKKNE